MTGVLVRKKRRRFETQTHREEGRVKTEAGTGHKSRSYQKLEEARKDSL